MKWQLLFYLLVIQQILLAQNFTEVQPPLPFEKVSSSSIAFADVNGDGYQDVLITGKNIFADNSTKLYINDGIGNFSEKAVTPFDDVSSGSIAFADVNGDNYQDVLITGRNNSSEQIAKLYINDGTGVFNELMNTPFEGVFLSSVAFADVNGDNYQDVLITGRNSLSVRIAKLYANDGEGNFSEIVDTPFDGVEFSSIAFADVNGDNYKDVLITGQNISDQIIAKLYMNDGTGNFNELTSPPFDGVILGSIDFADIDEDGSQDVLITGRNSAFVQVAKLYINDGTGNFDEMMGTPFEGVWRSSIAFADVNGSGHSDVVITGGNSSLEKVAKLYLNDGTGNFSEFTSTPFDGVDFSSIAFADVNGDDQHDVLITGTNNSNAPTVKLYTNDGDISFASHFLRKSHLDLMLFPNPSESNQLYVNYDVKACHEVLVQIFSINGEMLRQQNEYIDSGHQTLTIDISSLSSGSYFLELVNCDRKGVGKFIIR